MNVYPSPSRCNRDTSPRRGFFLISFAEVFFVSFLLFLLSQKKKQEKPVGKIKKKKGCSRSERSRELLSKLKIPPLATDCFLSPSANPTVPDLLVYLDGCGGRLLADSREGSGDRLWAEVVRSLRAVRVAGFACVADDHWSPLHYYR